MLSIFGVIITAGAIFYFSSISNDPVPQINLPIKSVMYHFTIFLLLAIFLIGSLKNPKIKNLISLILIALFYAAIDEIHQLFVPGRVASINDFIIDTLGILTANILYFINKRNRLS